MTCKWAIKSLPDSTGKRDKKEISHKNHSISIPVFWQLLERGSSNVSFPWESSPWFYFPSTRPSPEFVILFLTAPEIDPEQLPFFPAPFLQLGMVRYLVCFMITLGNAFCGALQYRIGHYSIVFSGVVLRWRKDYWLCFLTSAIRGWGRFFCVCFFFKLLEVGGFCKAMTNCRWFGLGKKVVLNKFCTQNLFWNKLLRVFIVVACVHINTIANDCVLSFSRIFTVCNEKLIEWCIELRSWIKWTNLMFLMQIEKYITETFSIMCWSSVKNFITNSMHLFLYSYFFIPDVLLFHLLINLQEAI